MMKDKGAEMKELFEKTIFRQSEKDSDSANFPEKMIGKFSKTLRGTLQRLSDILSDDISGKEDWEKRVHNLRENMERKWTGLKNKFDSFFRQEKQEEKKVSKRYAKGRELYTIQEVAMYLETGGRVLKQLGYKQLRLSNRPFWV
jgi:hypothetical protein